MPATVWKGFLSFGLVSFPVRLFSAARADHIHFNMLHRKDLSRIKEVWYCAEENKPVDRSDIVKGYETSKGEYVVVEDEELKKIAPASASTMELLQFVREEEGSEGDLDHAAEKTSRYGPHGGTQTQPGNRPGVRASHKSASAGEKRQNAPKAQGGLIPIQQSPFS